MHVTMNLYEYEWRPIENLNCNNTYRQRCDRPTIGEYLKCCEKLAVTNTANINMFLSANSSKSYLRGDQKFRPCFFYEIGLCGAYVVYRRNSTCNQARTRSGFRRLGYLARGRPGDAPFRKITVAGNIGDSRYPIFGVHCRKAAQGRLSMMP